PGRAGVPRGAARSARAGPGHGRADVPLRLGPAAALAAAQARRGGGALRAACSRRVAGTRLDPAPQALRRNASARGPRVDRRAARRRGRTGRRAPALPVRPPAAVPVRLDRAGDRRAGVRVPQLRRGTTAPFAGLRVALVAAFNRRYHRSGLALAAALASLGCEVRRCEERRRGLAAVWSRSLVARLAAELGRRPADLVLVFKGTKLAPEAVRDLRARAGGRWVNWFPDDPHELAVSQRLAPAYDWFFTADSSSLDPHRRAGARAYYLAFGCDPAYLRPRAAGGRWRAPLVFVGTRDPARERVVRAVRDLGVVAWGPGWPNGPVYGRDFVRALAGATVGLNIHQHFGPGREILLYRSVAELREQARALLDDAAWRRSLAAAARERALREHTWAHRVEELLAVALR